MNNVFFNINFLLVFLILNQYTSAQSKNHFEELSNYFIQDGQSISWLAFSEEKLAYLTPEELRLLRNHIYARRGYIFKSEDLKKHFSNYEWYHPRLAEAESQLNNIEKNNISLVQVFENAKRHRLNPFTGLDSRLWLKGCWQVGTSTVASALDDRFIFVIEDFSFAFIGSEAEDNISSRSLNFSGRYTIPDNSKIEFEIITKDMLVKYPAPTRKDTQTGKPVYTTGLRVETKHYEKDKGYNYKTVAIGDITSYTNPDGIEKVFVKIDGLVYWKISQESCD